MKFPKLSKHSSWNKLKRQIKNTFIVDPKNNSIPVVIVSLMYSTLVMLWIEFLVHLYISWYTQSVHLYVWLWDRHNEAGSLPCVRVCDKFRRVLLVLSRHQHSYGTWIVPFIFFITHIHFIICSRLPEQMYACEFSDAKLGLAYCVRTETLYNVPPPPPPPLSWAFSFSCKTKKTDISLVIFIVNLCDIIISLVYVHITVWSWTHKRPKSSRPTK